MKFTFNHNNFNVLDLQKSIAFYEEALGLKVVRKYEAPDGSFILAYLGDGVTPHQLELTWLRDRKEPYNLGENEFHLAMAVDDMEAAHEKHEKWDASVLKTRPWAFISSMIRIITGWKSSREENNGFTVSENSPYHRGRRGKGS